MKARNNDYFNFKIKIEMSVKSALVYGITFVIDRLAFVLKLFPTYCDAEEKSPEGIGSI